jgi:hypothetical protein
LLLEPPALAVAALVLHRQVFGDHLDTPNSARARLLFQLLLLMALSLLPVALLVELSLLPQALHA